MTTTTLSRHWTALTLQSKRSKTRFLFLNVPDILISSVERGSSIGSNMRDFVKSLSFFQSFQKSSVNGKFPLDDLERAHDNDADEDKTSSKKDNNAADLVYGIDDKPPWYTCVILGLQHYLTMFGATLSIPFIICPALCIEPDDPARGYIISTLLFISGLVTLIQATFGIRLPIVQGGTFSFLAPTFAILSLEQNQVRYFSGLRL